jgi:hypothetical protein
MGATWTSVANDNRPSALRPDNRLILSTGTPIPNQ